MNQLSRSMKNLFRLYGRTALMVAVLSVIIVLSMVGFTVREGAEQTIAKARTNAGNSVTLSLKAFTGNRDSPKLTDELVKSMLTEDVEAYDISAGESVIVNLPNMDQFSSAPINYKGKVVHVNASLNPNLLPAV
ncbi:hypothetical protein ACI7RC_27070 [Brevibacillus sp. B_LB10_24]|uniref:hypothetical protein n=1 Tax=Brevibacillus sp. B_LB10_24 TaxID=3380645 RepID=UPI0038BA55A3